MNQREDAAETEQRGPAPSVSTPLLFLVMLGVVAAFSIIPVVVSPSNSPLKPLLIALIFVPALLAWWFWARQRQHPQLMFVLALAFLTGQFFSTLAQIVLLGEAYSRTIAFMWLNLSVSGLGFLGGLLYLWVQARKGNRN
ncbi:hypothetical protein ACFP9V_16650 [Deinococcus radiopugnans]|uniref:RsiW-degrading membrane proteinase PrsW (M82 family) n=1 Tax=Deinococcus radiopugnans ATCC 19172 TaxID=585398 RepID=A0A5C4Y5G0_9DEIO|nr:hypothetical protein [Deinococcus radiopugnans]MBB6016656.1 RsiW-degrading membrane proteinase PrsW (M82 family) [Deinococcus radiopugnans ATCC 19172]TNM70772.1 hypothetical protein FHR04_11410 [Deinococcus radiopugnans ATCC 19172]